MKPYWLFVLLVPLLADCKMLGNRDDGPDIPGKIVFSAEDDRGTPQIYTMKADGSNVQQLTDFGPNDEAVQPSWSPDGQQIVFSTTLRSSSNGLSLYIMDADGENMRPMNEREGSFIPTPGNHARWSPDGTQIAFDRCVNCQVGTNIELFVYEFATDSVIQLTDTDYPVTNSNPTWSPDGSRIAFASDRAYMDADTMRWREDLYVIDVTGNNLTRLTETGNATRPVWSPDSNKIAYEWNIQGNEVFIFDFSSGRITNVETGLEFAGGGMWNNDGTKLLVSGRKTKGAQPEMRLLNIEDKPPEVLEKLMLDVNKVGRDYDWHNDQ